MIRYSKAREAKRHHICRDEEVIDCEISCGAFQAARSIASPRGEQRFEFPATACPLKLLGQLWRPHSSQHYHEHSAQHHCHSPRTAAKRVWYETKWVRKTGHA